MFKIISESGVAAGVRRIEAITGQGVLDYIKEKDTLILNTAAALKTNLLGEIDKRAESVVNENKELAKEINTFREKMAQASANDIMAGIKKIGDVDVLVAELNGMSVDEIKTVGDNAKAKSENSLVVIGSQTDDKITFIAMASKGAVSKGIHCGNIIKEITAIAGGRGGGKPDMAQGGGKEKDKIDNALAMVDEIVKAQLGA